MNKIIKPISILCLAYSTFIRSIIIWTWQLIAYEVQSATLTNVFRMTSSSFSSSAPLSLEHSPLSKSYQPFGKLRVALRPHQYSLSAESNIISLALPPVSIPVRILWCRCHFGLTLAHLQFLLMGMPPPPTIQTQGSNAAMDDQSMPLLSCRCSNCCLTQTSRRVRARIQGQLISYMHAPHSGTNCGALSAQRPLLFILVWFNTGFSRSMCDVQTSTDDVHDYFCRLQSDVRMMCTLRPPCFLHSSGIDF